MNASVQDENQQQLLELEHQLAEVVFYRFFNRGWLEDSPYMEVAMEYSRFGGDLIGFSGVSWKRCQTLYNRAFDH